MIAFQDLTLKNDHIVNTVEPDIDSFPNGMV